MGPVFRMTDNKWARKPKPESKAGLNITRKYYAYLDGVFKGEAVLGSEAKKRHEAKGYTFKPVFR